MSDIAGSEIKNMSTKCVDTCCRADDIIGSQRDRGLFTGKCLWGNCGN